MKKPISQTAWGKNIEKPETKDEKRRQILLLRQNISMKTMGKVHHKSNQFCCDKDCCRQKSGSGQKKKTNGKENGGTNSMSC